MNPGVQLPLDIRLRDDSTFNNYVGEAGRLVAAASGIVYVWGEPGTGRTHLLQAACRAARDSELTAIYLSDLDRHFPEMFTDLERLALVCVDDMDRVLGRENWEMALFHLVNGVRDTGGTLMLSGSKPAVELPVALADLRSRLIAANAIRAGDLDDASKRTLLKQRAATQGIDLADEVVRFIMSRSDRSLRSLITLLEQLDVETLRRQKKVTIPLVKQVLHW